MSILPCGVTIMAACGVASSSLTPDLFHLPLKMVSTSVSACIADLSLSCACTAHVLAPVTFDLSPRYLAHAGKAVTSLPGVFEASSC